MPNPMLELNVELAGQRMLFLAESGIERLQTTFRELRTVIQGAPGKTELPPPYAVENGVAVIRVTGVMLKNMHFPPYATSTRQTLSAARQAMADPNVRALFFQIDSPGGTVDGCKDLADGIHALRGGKPMAGYADGCMCSAAYYLAASIGPLAAPQYADVGSIGVVAAHFDFSKALEDFGVKVTYLTAGKYKAMGNSAEPLSDEAREYLLGQIDHVYDMFLNDVARYRGISRDRALAMADGKVFVGRQALDAGLVDTIADLEAAKTLLLEEIIMDRKELQTKHPELVAEIQAEARAEFKDHVPAKQASDMVAAESGRILGLAAELFGESGKKLAEVAATGVTVAQLAALKGAGLAPEAKEDPTKKAILDGLTGAHAGPLNPGAEGGAGDKGFMAMAKEYAQANKCSLGQAIKIVAEHHPDKHDEYVAGLQTGGR